MYFYLLITEINKSTKFAKLYEYLSVIITMWLIKLIKIEKSIKLKLIEKGIFFFYTEI